MSNITKTESGKLHGLTSDQKRRAEQLTSIFENDTVEPQYAYTEDLHDGRGITAGRAGFTTRDGDALEVVEIYTKKVPKNNLAKFLPERRSANRCRRRNILEINEEVPLVGRSQLPENQASQERRTANQHRLNDPSKSDLSVDGAVVVQRSGR